MVTRLARWHWPPIIALVIALVILLCPAAPTPVAQADFGAPGGIAALPASIPAIPGVANQGVSAIIGSGQPAIVVVFCDDGTGSLPVIASPCANPISFQLTRFYPDHEAPLATFDATETDALAVTDNSEFDMDAALGVVAIQVNAGSVNEVVRVIATDETDDSRFVDIVVVDTMLAWGPTGAVTHDGPVFISYRCDAAGRVPLGPIPASIDPDADGSQGLDDMYDGYYASVYDGIGPGLGYGSNTLVGDVDFIDTWCGGNTSSLFDDFVDFQTNKGVFSIDPMAVAATDASHTAGFVGVFYPPVLDDDCGEGMTVDTFDIDVLTSWAAFLSGWPPGGPAEGGCDLDGWRNSIVTTELLGNGEFGVATITAQQGGGLSPPHTVNVRFVGPAVGGIAELPDFAGTSGKEAGVASEGSGWSAGNYVALAGGLAAATLAVIAGAWYARRRWLR
jgi:hypothetical protein